ncbi:Hypothetical protein NTJ_03621 [Nesidiocoris tenuis]|uniref:Uncharacterized protein n=1 Tax=Nesidiocoris tenuis TaxID=355587 RepID=A0ABN7AFJ3_9HEMI|nr:Hypothetical protein NTJ_03621 [Nesidiocoris tenuis]
MNRTGRRSYELVLEDPNMCGGSDAKVQRASVDQIALLTAENFARSARILLYVYTLTLEFAPKGSVNEGTLYED